MSVSPIVQITRRGSDNALKVSFENPASNRLHLKLVVNNAASYKLELIAINGQKVYERTITVSTGISTFDQDISFLKTDKYIVSIQNEKTVLTKSFIKTPY
ncbi:MAG: hypothetical protein C4330_04760 [Chitinophagaceae bacterium]